MIVFGSPAPEDQTGMVQSFKYFRFEALVSTPAIEALAEAVLHCFTVSDLVPETPNSKCGTRWALG